MTKVFSKNILRKALTVSNHSLLALLKVLIVGFIFTSCTFHMRTKHEAKTYFKLLKKSNKNYLTKQTEENNLLKFELKDSSNNMNNKYIFSFDDKGKQFSYFFKSSCYDCFSQSVKGELNEKRYRWKKQNDSTYVSKKRLNRILMIHSLDKSYEVKKYTSK